ncbi:protein G12-like [Hylaeus anthracinus]|uniref:protein G12-like n=1 Tax=Hylaeus anthracinus TaxID=313031 RepID=UPI0023B98BA9|nr:protein G12-like [Hylaeus anthracinus]
MKFVLSVLAVLALAGSLNARAVHVTVPSTGSGALAKEMQDFMDLIPVDRVMAVLRAYAAQDKEFQTVIKLVDSKETVMYIEELEAHPAAKDLMKYMQNAGLDIYLLVNKLNAALGIESITSFAFHKITGGLRGLAIDLEATVPIKQMEDLLESKMVKSPVFAAFVKEVGSPKYFDLYDNVYTNQHVVNIAEQAKQAGIHSIPIEQYYMHFIVARQILKLHP